MLKGLLRLEQPAQPARHLEERLRPEQEGLDPADDEQVPVCS